jgi:UDP:flavonoid glycosyltransferase YjiC (YdhE family)
VYSFVTHCGHNSVYEAVMTKTVPICFPLFFEQVDSAARVVSSGVGLRVANRNNYTAEEVN